MARAAAVMDAAAVALVSSIAGAVGVTDVGADVVEEVTAGADAAAEAMPGADAVAEDIGPVAMATPGMDTLNLTIETAIREMDMNESVRLARTQTVTMEIVTATRPAKNRAMDRRMRKAATMLRPRSS
jgi:hypothetical protein